MARANMLSGYKPWALDTMPLCKLDQMKGLHYADKAGRSEVNWRSKTDLRNYLTTSLTKTVIYVRWPLTMITWLSWRRWRCLSMPWTIQQETTWPNCSGLRVPVQRFAFIIFSPSHQKTVVLYIRHVVILAVIRVRSSHFILNSFCNPSTLWHVARF